MLQYILNQYCFMSGVLNYKIQSDDLCLVCCVACEVENVICHQEIVYVVDCCQRRETGVEVGHRREEEVTVGLTYISAVVIWDNEK